MKKEVAAAPPIHERVRGTKDLPIKEIEREAYHRRKQKYHTHHVKEEKLDTNLVGKELVDKALHEIEERAKEREHIDELAAFSA